jgi:spermidine synthase
MLIKNENNIKFSVFVVGLTSMVTQIILLRNLLSVFSGNELVVGIILANWMMLTALGAYAGRYIIKPNLKFRLIIIGHLLLGILPILLSFLIFYLRNVIYPPGKMINLFEIFISTFILLSPICILTGLLFTTFSSVLSRMIQYNVIRKVYAFEAIGAMVGGLLFNFVFIFLFNNFFSLKILMMINFGTAIFLYLSSERGIKNIISGFLIIILAGFIIVTDINSLAYAKLFQSQNLIDQVDSPYSSLAITETSGQLNFYQNGDPLFSTDDVITNEESVHFAMLQHHNPKNILLISGGISGSIDEILKYNVTSVDYVEADPEIIQLGNKYVKNISKNSKVNIINRDARLYLKEHGKKYDVVLINLPDPSNTFLNRYYTIEFIEELKRRLSSSSVISLSLSSSANYLSNESRSLHSSLFATLKLVFENVIIIPGQQNYFLASDVILSSEIANLCEIRKIENEFVNPYFIDDNLILERRNTIEKTITDDVIINYDFFPALYLMQLKIWLNKFHFDLILGILIFLFIIVYILPRLHFVNLGMFSTGFSATALEILLLVGFQVIYGYIYFMIGVFITVFMGGLVIGSLFIHKYVKVSFKNYSLMQYLIGIFAILTPLVLLTIKNNQMSPVIVHSVFVFLMLIIGTLTGLQYSFAAKLRYASISKTAAGTYGSDLLGSAIGALIVATILIPLFGLIKACLIISILNFLTGLIILYKTGKQ